MSRRQHISFADDRSTAIELVHVRFVRSPTEQSLMGEFSEFRILATDYNIYGIRTVVGRWKREGLIIRARKYSADFSGGFDVLFTLCWD